ncbi:PAP2 superfamily protein [Sarocladium implicatum]|nr:PAP2 superfamily protein [Sarocladium implicatum]
MDFDSSRPGSPAGGPLQVVTPDRVNQQRDSPALGSGARDSSVHEKINQFNNMSVLMQSKNLERKTADAALKRAMIGREEAEAEVHRYRDEAKALRKALDEGKERERRVMERLETVMENYGRAKETHAHTQALWEKEIRRARKENFKSQSTTVKLQEELKSCRTKVKSVQDALDSEKERSHVREQEAFTARYQIVGVQQELEQALERIKVIEQERDAYKTAAQNEEVARIAAEGRIPLPKNEDPEDEFASPKKITKRRVSGMRLAKNSRVSLSAVEILSSEASEMEIEDLRFQVQAERSRAERAEEMVDFLQAECQMHCCPCSKNKSSVSSSSREGIEEHHESVIVHPPPVDRMHVDVEEAEAEPEEDRSNTPEPAPRSLPKLEEPDVELLLPRSKKEPRRSTIFCPKEGIFRTVSEQEAEALQAHLQEMEETQPEEYDDMQVEEVEVVDIDEVEEEEADHEPEPRFYARTPSVEPPAFAILAKDRTSLMSLLNAPSNEANSAPLPSIPSIPTMPDEHHQEDLEVEDAVTDADDEVVEDDVDPIKRPHTSFASYSISTTTTTVPVRDETDQLASSSSFAEKLRTPSSGSNASFDLNNPALTPTMTREQALAKIRERRGRARSVEKKTATAGVSGSGVRSATGGSATPALKKTSADRVDRRTASGLTRKPSKGR